MAKKVVLPESPLEGKSWPRSRDQDLPHFLAMLESEFHRDTSNTLPAFEAVNLIASHLWERDQSSPEFVSVPWWTVEVLAMGYNIYRDGALSNAPLKLGEAFGLEGGGQGKQPRIQQSLQKLRDIRIAGAIAFNSAEGVKIEAALQEQADLTQLSVGQIRRIWEENREQAENAVKNFPRA